MTRVDLPLGLYFEVTEVSFDLYYKDPEKKSAKALGYYTTMEALLKKATQFTIAQMKSSMEMRSFLDTWSATQAELAGYLSKHKIE